jgi:hypothetical protein
MSSEPDDSCTTLVVAHPVAMVWPTGWPKKTAR